MITCRSLTVFMVGCCFRLLPDANAWKSWRPENNSKTSFNTSILRGYLNSIIYNVQLCTQTHDEDN